LTPGVAGRAPDDVYRELQAPFSEEKQVKLTLLIVAIMGSPNRLRHLGAHTVQ
jgi:hypothetical protein